MLYFIIFCFQGYALFKEGQTCKVKDFTVGETRQSQGYQLTIDDCYTKCKNEIRISTTLFMYHIRGNADADCSAQGCFCACYDTRNTECGAKPATKGNLYRILGKARHGRGLYCRDIC